MKMIPTGSVDVGCWILKELDIGDDKEDCRGLYQDHMKSWAMSQKEAQIRNKWRRRIKGQLANPRVPANGH